MRSVRPSKPQRAAGGMDRILGLEVAGDHYVTRPINLRDLLARAELALSERL